MVVVGVTRPGLGPAMPRRRAGDGRSFAIRSEQTAASDAAVATGGVAASSLLLLQEAESDAQQDRAARQHGSAMLDELTDLQAAMLGPDGPDLRRLEVLLARPVAAVDPGLAGLLRAVRLRAGLELARRGCAATM